MTSHQSGTKLEYSLDHIVMRELGTKKIKHVRPQVEYTPEQLECIRQANIIELAALDCANLL